ncbi:MAG: YhgE/Pip domain-containing protein [Streptococcaceae bacterium]|nr:YhgE/Pip domain-containing protein [Streptococcaceae bacterium]
MNWKKLGILPLAVLIPAAVFYFSTHSLDQMQNATSASDIKILVVNNDKAVESNGTKVNAGQQVIDKLKDNKQFKWEFVSQDQATKALKDNSSLMSLEIPQDFSKNTASLLDKNPQQAQLNINLGNDNTPVTSALFKYVADNVTSQVETNIQQQYGNQLLGGVSQLADGTRQTADAANQLNAGSHQLFDGSTQLKGGLGTLNGSIPTLESGVNQLNSGASELNANSSTLVNGVSSLSSGLGLLSTGGNQLNSGLGTLNAQTPALVGGTQQLVDSIKGTASQINDGLASQGGQLTQLEDGLNQLTTALSGLTSNPDAAHLATALTNIQTVLPSINTEVATLKSNVTTEQGIITAMQNDPSVSTVAASYIAQLQAQVNAENAQVTALSHDSTMLELYFLQAGTAATNINNSLSQLQASGPLATQGAVQAIDGLKGNLQEISSGITAQEPQMDQLTGGGAQLQSGVNLLATGGSQLSAGINQANSQVSSTLVPGVKQYTGGVGQVANGAQQLADGAKPLASGVEQLASGADQLSGGLGTMSDGTGILSSTLNKALPSLPIINSVTQSENQLASPVKDVVTQEPNVNKFSNYFAPTLIVLALALSALMVQIHQLAKRGESLKDKNTFLTLASVAGLTTIGIGVGILLTGMSIQHPIALFLAVAVSTVVLYGFALSLSKVFGRLGLVLAIAFVLLQVALSTALFPSQLLGSFGQLVRSFLPGIYLTNMFNYLTNGQGSILGGIIALVLLGAVAFVLLISMGNKAQSSKTVTE